MSKFGPPFSGVASTLNLHKPLKEDIQ